MAYINGNKPIVTDGLIYALDFGNSRSYLPGSTQATSMAYDQAVTSVSGSPAYDNGLLTFTGTQYIKRNSSLPALDPDGTFTVMVVGQPGAVEGTLLHQDSFNATANPSSSLFGFELGTGTLSRTYPGLTTSSLQHITYRYSQGTVDTFINGIPVTASQANSALTTTAVSNALFLGDITNGFSGSLAQFYVYNRALSADEIYQTYLVSAGRNGLPEIPKPYTQDENVYKYVQTTGITDNDTISAISTFVSSLKSNGLWNKMTAIYPFLTTSTGSQAVNLKDPGVLGLGLTGSFTGSNIGLTPANSTAYVDTLPSNTPHPLINSASAHLSLVSYDVPQTSSYLAGNFGTAGATGGNIFVDNGRIYHVFTTGSSTFTPVHPSINAVEVLVVAGGGAGGSSGVGGGGGGAGGLVYSSSFSVTPSTPYTTVVGEPGTGSAGTFGSNGQNSQFGTIVAIGGGGGAGTASIAAASGSSGGSGGGGTGRGSLGVIGIGGLGTAGQGNNGGNGTAGSDGGGGGGGAGTPGSNALTPGGGNGGSGSFFPQFVNTGYGSPAGWFAGGGGGATGGGPTGSGGIGGGGDGNPDGFGLPSKTGSINTGGGGGGTPRVDISGGKGGSGIIIVSYPAIPGGPGTGIFITDSSVTGSLNSEFSGGVTGSGTIGFLTVSRTGSGLFSLHKNNISQSINSPASNSLSLDNYLGGINLAGGTSSLGNSNTSISYASIGAGLTDSEVSTYYNLVPQFQTNLKRQNTLLDNYSGAAAAYSLRRIGPSGYFGPAIRVRRDSDNALRDIGFTSDGQLDTVGLLDFVGVTGSGFVQTWYDQSGNGNNAIKQTGDAKIIEEGTLINYNGKPALKVGYSGRVILGTPLTEYTHLLVVAKTDAINKLDYLVWNSTTPSGFWFVDKNANPDRGLGGTDGTTSHAYDTNPDLNQHLGWFSMRDSKLYIQKDNLPELEFSPFADSLQFNEILGRDFSGGSLFPTGRIQEYVFYNSDQAANRIPLTSNINTNYKIYGDATASFDPDYQAFITATGITEPTQSAALETLVSDLKSYGLWNKMKAIYPMVTDKNNRFAYSQQLGTGWNPSGSSVTESLASAPDGTSTSNLIKEDSSTVGHYIYQTIDDGGLVTGSEYVASVYSKFYNRQWIAIDTNTGAKAWFDVQNGITGSYTGSNATITAVSGGWYRCALYFTSSVASGPQNIQYHLADTDGNLEYAGVDTTGSYLWGAQFENGNVLGPYRATTTVGFTTGSMLDQMKFNLVNPVDSDAGFRLTYSGSLNSGYSGIKGDATTGYIITNFNPSSSQPTANNLSLSTYSRTFTINLGSDLGSSDGSSFIDLKLSDGSNNLTYDGFDNTLHSLSTTNTDTRGYYLVNHNGATTTQVFKNKIQITGSSVEQTLPYPDSRISILTRLDNDTTPTTYSDRETALVTIGDGLTDYQAKALYWIVQKYQTTLGRQVY